jgi:transcriptional regulator with XRE-family HTH domain
MGTRSRSKPERLAEKLRQIREALGLSQNGMITRMGAEDLVAQNAISEFELGKREPSLLVLLKYAEAAGVCLDVLANDDLDLPAKLPSKAKHSHR